MTTLVLLYTVAFCRIVIGLVFVISFVGKVLNIPEFKQTIAKFGILPERLNSVGTFAILGCELGVVLLVSIGGVYLGFGFALAACLLLVFCIALVSVLARRIQTPCNCFGATEQPVSSSDVWRNVVFM